MMLFFQVFSVGDESSFLALERLRDMAIRTSKFGEG